MAGKIRGIMGFQHSFKNLDDVPEGLRDSVSKQQDGSFILEGETTGAIDNLKTALERQKAELKDLKGKLSSFEGIDPEEVRQANVEREKRQREDAARKGEWEKLEAKLKADHAKELAVRDKQLSKWEAAAKAEMIDGLALRAITAAKGRTKLLLPHVKAALKLLEGEDGTFQTVVVDEKGEARLKPGAKTATDYLTPEEFVLSLREDDEFANAFDGEGISGSGSLPGHGTRSRTNSAQDAIRQYESEGVVFRHT